MPKLNQLLAVEKGAKTRAHTEITAAHHQLQKPELMKGIQRSYRPVDEEGEKLPSESTKVQVKAEDVIKRIQGALAELFNVTAAKDNTNCQARADVVVDGVVLAKQVPVTHLLFLEKQLVDMHTFVKKLPTLDQSENWIKDEAQNLWATEPVETHRSKKLPKVVVLAQATDKHPAQTQLLQEDVLAGYWRTVKFSGALPARRVEEMLERVEKLQRSVKFAREEANGVEVADLKTGEAVLGYIFGIR